MSRHSLIGAALGVALAALAAPALAHHSFAAEFDINQPLELKGEVIRMVFTNPHSRIFLKVTTESGEVQEWSIEGGAPNALIRRGVTKASVPVGVEVTVEGFRAKDGSNTANGRTVTLADGRGIFTGSSYTGPAPSDLNRK